MIPRKIHYCWFGGNALPDSAKKCISSWRKFFPDYEIIEWNENNFDVTICKYVKEAYDNKKWAFVSDYVRFWVLYKYGGIYFDTDVEVISKMDDIVSSGAFMGIECYDKTWAKPYPPVAPGLGMGMPSGMKICSDIIDNYNKESFLEFEKNGKNVIDFTSEVLYKNGLRNENCIQKVCGITVYPSEFFCPYNYYNGETIITKNTKTIHWYDSSWLSETTRKIISTERLIEKNIPHPFKRISKKAVRYAYRLKEYSKNGQLIGKINKKIRRKKRQ